MATRNLESVALPLDKFNWHSRELTAEASDLQWAGTMQLYDDAADVGIAIRSHVTGRIGLFYLDREEWRDGDLLAWHFRPVQPLAGENAAITRNVDSVTIYND